MAKGKNNIIIYRDWWQTIQKLSDEEAGQMFKHLLAYVNDENPEPPSRIVELMFEPWKQQLKRDLKKWEAKSQRNREIAQKRWNKDDDLVDDANASERIKNDTKNADTDNDTDNDNDTDKDIIKTLSKNLMSKIKISDVPNDYQKYFEIAEKFRNLFIKNLTDRDAPTHNQENAKFKAYVDPIRLMLTNDGITKEQLGKAFLYLEGKNSEFWKKNILSTEKLRKQIDTILMEAGVKKTSNNNNDNKPIHKNR